MLVDAHQLDVLNVTETSTDTDCACTQEMIDLVEKAVKKHFGKKAHPGFESTTVTYPVLIQGSK